MYLNMKKKLKNTYKTETEYRVSYDDGAYCAAPNEKEAGFAALSVEKSCIAQIAATRSDGARVISKRDVRRLTRNNHRK